MVAIDGCEVDMPDSPDNATEFGYAGSGDNRSAFPKARVVAVAECGTHAFLAAEIGAYKVGERTLAARLYPHGAVDGHHPPLLVAGTDGCPPGDRDAHSFGQLGHDSAPEPGPGL